MKRLGRIAAAFMASVFFLTGIPAMTAFAADEIPAAEEVVTETPAVEPVAETPVPETPAPETPDPVVVAPENGGGTPDVTPTTPVVTEGAQDVADSATTTEDVDETVTDEPKTVETPTKDNAEANTEEEPTVKAIAAETPFNNSTMVADGVYHFDGENVNFAFSGGSGKVTYELDSVTVKNGMATAVLKTNSTSMSHVYIGPQQVGGTEGNITELYDPETGEKGVNVYEITESSFEIPVRVNEEITFAGRSTARGKITWVEYKYTISISADAKPEEQPFNNSTTLQEGTYKYDGNKVNFAFSGGSGKVTYELDSVTVKNGMATAVLKTNSTSMSHVYIGPQQVGGTEGNITELYDPETGKKGVNVYEITESSFEIPVRVNEEITFVGRSTARGKITWVEYKYTITISDKAEPDDPTDEEAADYTAVDAALAKVKQLDLSKYTDESVAALNQAINAVVRGKTKEAQAEVDSMAKAIEDAVANLVVKGADGGTIPFEELTDGTYTAKVIKGENAGMFPVAENCTVVKKGDKFTVTIQMKSADNTSQDKVFLGKAADAPNNATAWIEHKTNKANIYTFELNNVPIGEWFDLASHSSARDQWYDRQLMIDKDSFKTVSDDESGSSDDSGSGSGNKPNQTPTNDGKAEQESAHTTDLSKSTSAVDNSTSLADGVYTPDKFSFSGGSGRGSFTCTKVTVTDGKAYATLVFSSNNYEYVKASGNIYYCDHSTGLSSVTIPVALNQNNTIVAMTTAMSQNHEITYTMFVYIAGADAQKGGALNSNEELDKEAPVIPGLTFEGEEKLEYAENFKIFNYSEGIRLLEIDMRLRDDKDDAKKDDGKSSTKIDETTKKNAVLHDDEDLLIDTKEVPAEETGDDTIATTADAQAELYKGNVIKYLLVPENVEIPAGLEKEVIVINLPVESVYSGSDEIREIFKELKIEDLITSQVEEDKDNKDIVAAGDYKDLDLKALIKSKCDLVILPEESIEAEDVKDEKAQKEAKENFEKLAEDLANLDVPVLVDRADYEETDNAKAEWIKIFGILFNCEKEANALFETMTK